MAEGYLLFLFSLMVVSVCTDFTRSRSSGSACRTGSTSLPKLSPRKSVVFHNRIVFFPQIKFIGGTMSSRRFLSNFFWSVMFCDLKRCVL